MEDPALWGTASLIILLAVSGFFSAALEALSSVRRQSLRDLAEQGNAQARLAAEVAEDSTRFLSAFGLANVIIHFAMAALLAVFLIPPLADWLAGVLPIIPVASYTICYVVALPVAALVVYVITQALPQILVHRDPVQAAMSLAGMAKITITVMTPLVAAVTALRRAMAAPLGGTIDGAAMVTEEEIMTLVDAGEEEGSIEQEEKEMIYSIFQLDETLAREIMVPRIDVVAVDLSTSLVQAGQVIIEAGHSRIPVFDETLDRIRGLLYAKDLLRVWQQGDKETDLTSLLRPALFVPESKRVSDLLHEMQNSKLHMAVVIDEYGGTAGLVTIEDIVEEIVGEIFDEYDEEAEAEFEAIGPDKYVFDGRINLDDLNHLLDADLSDEMGDTLAGYIYAKLGKVPQVGEIIEGNRLRMEVLDVVDRRIRKVSVTRLSASEPPSLEAKGSPGEDSGKNGNGR